MPPEPKGAVGKARMTLEAVTPKWPEHTAADYAERMAERDAVIQARDAMHDEVAMARVFARRGTAPEPEWLKESDDPRMEAYRTIFAERLKDLVEQIETARSHGLFKVLADKTEALRDLVRSCTDFPPIDKAP